MIIGNPNLKDKQAHVTPSLHPLQPSKNDVVAHDLIKNGIPPSTLLRSQLVLFENAERDQKLRLIELWSIVPPNYAKNGGQTLADRLGEYQTTTMDQEEKMAWWRYHYQSGSRTEEMDEDEPALISKEPGHSGQ